MKSLKWLGLIFILLLAACQTTTPVQPTLALTEEVAPTPAETKVSPFLNYPAPGESAGTEGAYPSPQAVGYPAPGQWPAVTISWEEAQNLILTGQVASILQHQDLTVDLVLKDQRVFRTSEPAMDDVIKLISECGDKCKDTAVATE